MPQLKVLVSVYQMEVNSEKGLGWSKCDASLVLHGLGCAQINDMVVCTLQNLTNTHLYLSINHASPL